MQKCQLILELRVRLVSLKMFKPSSYFFCWTFPGGASFVDLFCYLCFMFTFGMLSCLFLAALWSPAGKGLTSCISCVLCFLVFLSLFHMVFWIRYGTRLIVSIPDLYLPLYFNHEEHGGSVVEYWTRDWGAEPHWRHCIVSLSKTLYPSSA